MKWEAVIFDWAGTTVDYGCFAPVQAFMEIFKKYGIEPTMEETRKPMGMLKWDHIKTMLQMERIRGEFQRVHGRDFTDQDVDEMHEQFEAMLLKILDSFAEPKEYVVETVAKLREKGLKIGSTTGYNNAMMEIVTREAKKAGLLNGMSWEEYKMANNERTKLEVDPELYSVVANSTGFPEDKITIKLVNIIKLIL